MCNAYSLTHPRSDMIAFAEDLARQLDLVLAPSPDPPSTSPPIRYRISPTQFAPILRLGEAGELALDQAYWGFLVAGARRTFAPTNARDDRLTETWPWQQFSRAQRCLVPADGFFEPEKPAGAKGTVPWRYYAMGNRQPFYMAGLYNRAPHPKTGAATLSFTIVTTEANALIYRHNRMPAILDDEACRRWLAPGAVPHSVLGPFPASQMIGHRVCDAARNSRALEHPSMIEPFEAPHDLFS